MQRRLGKNRWAQLCFSWNLPVYTCADIMCNNLMQKNKKINRLFCDRPLSHAAIDRSKVTSWHVTHSFIGPLSTTHNYDPKSDWFWLFFSTWRNICQYAPGLFPSIYYLLLYDKVTPLFSIPLAISLRGTGPSTSHRCPKLNSFFQILTCTPIQPYTHPHPCCIVMYTLHPWGVGCCCGKTGGRQSGASQSEWRAPPYLASLTRHRADCCSRRPGRGWAVCNE